MKVKVAFIIYKITAHDTNLTSHVYFFINIMHSNNLYEAMTTPYPYWNMPFLWQYAQCFLTFFHVNKADLVPTVMYMTLSHLRLFNFQWYQRTIFFSIVGFSRRKYRGRVLDHLPLPANKIAFSRPYGWFFLI